MKKSIDKTIVSGAIIGIIILILIAGFIINAKIINDIYNLIIVFPFAVFWFIGIISFTNSITKIIQKNINKNDLFINKKGIKVEAKVIEIKREILRGRAKNYSTVYYYYIICEWIDKVKNKKYIFKSGNLWMVPVIKIGTSLDVYVDKDNFKKYYVNIEKIEQNDQERVIKEYLKNRKYSVFKLFSDFSDIKFENNYLIGKERTRKKDIKINVKSIRKIIRVFEKEELKKFYIETFGKQIEIKLRSSKKMNELNEYLKINVKNSCKELENRFEFV